MAAWIGILSDSHGNLARTRRAIELIRAYHPVHVFHCGDICGQEIVDELAAGFADPEVPVTCVLGNCDGWGGSLTPALPHVRIGKRFAECTVAGKHIAMTHGHDEACLREASSCGRHDYVFTGHTHLRADEHVGRTRVINPGALHRSAEPGCAVLNLETDELIYLDVT